MDVFSLICVALIILLISVWLTSRKDTKNALPGPSGLPILGYLPFMDSKPYIKFQQLAKKYGPVYKVKLGSRELVILCDFKSIKDAFANDDFIGRPPDLPFELSETTMKTGAFLGLPWKEQRKFSLQALRDLGFGKTRMEGHLKEEILEVIERLEAERSKPVKISDILAPSVSNNIASFLFGKRLKYDDPKRRKLDQQLSDVGLLAGAVAWQMFFPWIRAFMIYFKIGNNGKMSKALSEIRAYALQEMKEHEATLDPHNIRDFMDSYLIQIEKKKDDENSGFKKDVLADLTRGFFGAGSETVRITLDWMALIAAAYPEVQKKIQQEIDEVLGRDRFPNWQDHLDMPYTEAAILELMRWQTIIPLNIMRYTIRDTELNGFFIPKHSYVLAVLYCLDHDKELWGDDVYEYKPERFLSKDGRKIVKPDHFIPFSIGKRSCPGKILAEIEIFLYLTAILQKFNISMPAGKSIDFEGVLGIGLQPKRQDICFQPR